MTFDEATRIIREAEAWCDSSGDGPQPCTFGMLTAAALVAIQPRKFQNADEAALAMTQAALMTLARDIMTIAHDGGMPSSFWQTDQRIQRACTALDVEQGFAQLETEENYEEWKKP